ncbi:MAG: hypothetical protein WC548_02785 [Candidatus Pacearchaeota archaeon]
MERRNVIYDKIQDWESEILILPGIGEYEVHGGSPWCWMGQYSFQVKIEREFGSTVFTEKWDPKKQSWKGAYKKLKQKVIEDMCPLFAPAIKFRSQVEERVA